MLRPAGEGQWTFADGLSHFRGTFAGKRVEGQLVMYDAATKMPAHTYTGRCARWCEQLFLVPNSTAVDPCCCTRVVAANSWQALGQDADHTASCWLREQRQQALVTGLCLSWWCAGSRTICVMVLRVLGWRRACGCTGAAGNRTAGAELPHIPPSSSA